MKRVSFNSYKYRLGRCGRCVSPLLALVILALSATASGGDGNRYSYAELAQAVRDSLEIEVDRGEKVVYMRDGGKTDETLRGKSLHAWVRSIAGSPGVREALADFSPEHKVILNTFRAINKALFYPRELYGEFLRFYCLHLASNNQEIRETAFEEMRRARWKHNDFESYLDGTARNALLEFVRKHPTYGDKDERGRIFQNGITMVGMSGGGEEAIDLLESLAGKVPGFEFSRKVALARLDNGRAKEFIKKYEEEEKNIFRKRRLAKALGQISTPDTLKVLARDLRSDLVDSDGVGFNQHVLAALCWARDWPEDAPWPSSHGMFDEEDFEAAEAWCMEKFDMKWERPKPPVRKLKLHIF